MPALRVRRAVAYAHGGCGGAEVPAGRDGGRTEPNDIEADLARALSDFEFAHLTFAFGFLRWVEKCMEATGLRGLTALDILVMHAVNLRARTRRLSEVCMVLNIDDSHLVAYSLKKLVSAGLVRTVKDGRESRFETTPLGDDACDRYRAVRSDFLVSGVASVTDVQAKVANMTALLNALTGIYDQSTRLATANSGASPQRPPVRTKR
jgi:predicted MarR family transcription regulator